MLRVSAALAMHGCDGRNGELDVTMRYSSPWRPQLCGLGFRPASLFLAHVPALRRARLPPRSSSSAQRLTDWRSTPTRRATSAW